MATTTQAIRSTVSSSKSQGLLFSCRGLTRGARSGSRALAIVQLGNVVKWREMRDGGTTLRARLASRTKTPALRNLSRKNPASFRCGERSLVLRVLWIALIKMGSKPSRQKPRPSTCQRIMVLGCLVPFEVLRMRAGLKVPSLASQLLILVGPAHPRLSSSGLATPTRDAMTEQICQSYHSFSLKEQ